LAAFHGFELFADGDNRWQVLIQPHTGVVFPGVVPLVPRSGPTHVALTVGNADAFGAKKQVTLFVDGKVTVLASVDSYSLPNGAALSIGVDNTTPDSPSTPQVRTPVLSKVQEVVLHRKALSQDEIENHATFKTQT
jgi:hypothetical protein